MDMLDSKNANFLSQKLESKCDDKVTNIITFDRIYAIDFGLKRIGIAKLLNNIALPLNAIIRKNRNQAAQDLMDLITESRTIDSSKIALIVGITHLDSNLDNNEMSNEFMRRVTHFITLMDFKGKVIFIDENLSSLEADSKILNRKYKTRQNMRKDGSLDSLSACIILERFIESNLKNML